MHHNEDCPLKSLNDDQMIALKAFVEKQHTTLINCFNDVIKQYERTLDKAISLLPQELRSEVELARDSAFAMSEQE